MADKRDAFARNLSVEIIGRIADKYGSFEKGTDFSYVATMLLTDFLGFVMFRGIVKSGWDEYVELISTEAKRRAERARKMEVMQ